MRHSNYKSGSSAFSSVSRKIDIGPRAEMEVFRAPPTKAFPEEAFFLSCRKAGTKGAFVKIDSEGLKDLRQWVNANEFRGLLARIEAREEGRTQSTVGSTVPLDILAPSPGIVVNPPAGLVPLDILSGGLGTVPLPAAVVPPHKTSSDDLRAELINATGADAAIFAGLDRQELVDNVKRVRAYQA